MNGWGRSVFSPTKRTCSKLHLSCCRNELAFPSCLLVIPKFLHTHTHTHARARARKERKLERREKICKNSESWKMFRICHFLRLELLNAFVICEVPVVALRNFKLLWSGENGVGVPQTCCDKLKVKRDGIARESTIAGFWR